MSLFACKHRFVFNYDFAIFISIDFIMRIADTHTGSEEEAEEEEERETTTD